MSSSHGRSWRPEKKFKKQDSRRIQIALVSTLLVALVGTIVFLVLRPGVPLLHFVVVSEHEFRGDHTALTPLPTGSTVFNATRLERLASRFQNQEPQRISECETHRSIAEFVSGKSHSTGESLIIYVGADAWCVEDKDQPGETALELLPSKPTEKPLRFSTLLTNFKRRNSAQTVMLLEFSGRHPGLASGALADDVPAQIRREVERAKIPGLTVICACEHGQRSWEYFSEPDNALKSISTATTASDESSKGQAALPKFEGTAFGYFICKALEEGKAGSAAELCDTLKSEVQPWAARHFGENQTVWMISADARWTKKELLKRARVQKEPEPETEPEVEGKAKPKGEAGDSATATEASSGGTSIDRPAAPTTQIESTPMALLEALRVRQNVLAEQTMVPVLFPGDWLQLQNNLAAAERFAMNSDRGEFDSLHDNVIRGILSDLEEKVSARLVSSEQLALSEWILPAALPSVSQDDVRLLKRLREDLSAEPAIASGIRLPDEFEERADFRRAMASAFLKDLKDLSESIADKSVEDRHRLIQRQIHLTQNLSSRWPNKVLPEAIAACNEVLHGNDLQWLGDALKPLVRLTTLRQQALIFASGHNLEERLLRREPWTKITSDIDLVLKHLHAAEKWLSIGPDGRELADDRLNLADQQLLRLKEQVEISDRISDIKDAQRFEIPYLIQYFSLRLDETPLQTNELNQAKAMAAAVLSSRLNAADFPEGPLEPVRLTRKHVEAMFALTRDFNKSEVTESDERDYLLLKSYIAERAAGPVSAADGRELLTIPILSDRKKILASLLHSPASSISVSTKFARRTGIWVSFWSLRLAHAIDRKANLEANLEDWRRWSELVAKSADSDSAEARSQRALMASVLRERWVNVVQNLKQIDNAEVFPADGELQSLVARDIFRRSSSRIGGNQSAYTGIQQALSDVSSPVLPASISVVNTNPEITADNAVATSVQVSQAAELYVLNNGLTLTNFPVMADRNWWRVKANANESTLLELALKLDEVPSTSRLLRLVAVNADGAPVSMTTTTLQPPADNAWKLEVVEVKEGSPERSITLEELPNSLSHRLKLLSSTLDPATGMHTPSMLKLRVRRTKGISKSIRVRVLHAEKGTVAWSLPEPLAIPDGDPIVDIPVVPPVGAVAGGAVPPAGPVFDLDVSDGLTFEITPDDLPRKISSRLTILPRLLEPERILHRPVPRYIAVDGRLEVPLVRMPTDNSSALQPALLPAQLEFSPSLQQYLKPGAILATPNADNYTFQVEFTSEIEKALNDDGLEFGISVAGIPHAWWWKLTDGRPVLLEGVPQVRAFLTIDNEQEVKPIAKSPQLLLGPGWQKAKLSVNTYLHGGQFDDGWSLDLFFSREGQNGVIRLQAPPFAAKGRYLETVRISPGENGVWMFSTHTKGYSIAPFLPAQYQLGNGKYQLTAALQKLNINTDPAMFEDVILTLDDSGPEFRAGDVKIAGDRTNANGVLKGSLQVVDQESGVRAVQVGLSPDSMVPVILTPGTQVNATFQLKPSNGFPKLEQKETDTEQTVSLLIEAENFAGIKTTEKKSITFYQAGKPKAPEKMGKAPGTIIVKFKSSSRFDASVKGNDNGVAKNLPNSSVSAIFSDLPPGSYTVEWKPVQGSLGKGTEAVILLSGKTVTVGPGK